MKRAKETLALLAAVLVAAIGWLAALLEDVFHWLHHSSSNAVQWLVFRHGPEFARKRLLEHITGAKSPGLTD